MKRVLLVTDVHYCGPEYGGISRDEKAERLIAQINEEYKKDPFECILFLGDYSLDHWEWQIKGSWLVENRSFTKELQDKYFSKLPTPYYMIAGNHEQYGEENWKALTGFSREFEVTVGDYLFILWESFGGILDPDFHSDGIYTAPDVKKIRSIMDANPGKKVFLCSHYFLPNNTEEEKELIKDERVVCLFQGHTHSSKIIKLPEEYGSKLLIQAGSWAGINNESKERWGVRELYLYDDKITTAYLVNEHKLRHGDLDYTFPAEVRDEAEIEL
jgi:predicted phosphodiesterase